MRHRSRTKAAKRRFAFTLPPISGVTDGNPADTILRPELGADPADNAALRDMADGMAVGETFTITPTGTTDTIQIERIQ